MADIDFSTITDPISDDQPCGPDLDMEFDMDFMNFTAEIDGLIPTRYFSFEPDTMPFSKFYDQISEFLEQTRDLRILVPLAKLKILEGDLQGFVDTLDAIARLLKEHWEHLHPQPVDFLEMSMGQLSTLDDMPNSVLPFQHANLFRTRRAGALTLRKWQVAKGEVNAREDEEKIDASLISGEITDASDDDIDPLMEKINKGREALAAIRATCIEEAGFDQAPIFEKLPEAFDAVVQMIDGARGGGEVAVEADADSDTDGAAPLTTGGTATIQLPTGDVQTREDAIEAMHQTARYFALNEPSSPAALLLREAQGAASKSFNELLNDLLPDNASYATITLGDVTSFRVMLGSLEQRNPLPDYESDSDVVEDSSWEDIGLDDGPTDNDTPAEDAGSSNDEPTEETHDAAEESGAEDASAEEEPAAEADEAEADEADADDSADEDAEPEPEPESNADFEDWGADPQPEPEPEPEPQTEAAAEGETEVASRFVVNSRPEAVAMMEKVLAYYRIAEPSSPVPLILQRAIDLTGKSFMELLDRVLPAGSLTPDE